MQNGLFIRPNQEIRLKKKYLKRKKRKTRQLFLTAYLFVPRKKRKEGVTNVCITSKTFFSYRKSLIAASIFKINSKEINSYKLNKNLIK